MHRRTGASIGIMLASFALVAGCSTSSSSSTDSTKPHSDVTSTTSTTVAPTTSEAPQPTRGAETSNDAAAQLVAAWEAKDKSAAAKIATPEAVAGIFATPDPAMWMRGCTSDPDLPEGGCVYRTETGLVQINTSREQIGWIVSSANYDAFDDGNATSGNAPDGP